jgi:hypothetical protein
MSYDEVAGKFRDCAAFAGLPHASADKIVELVRGLEEVGNMREVTKLLVK